MGEGGLDGFLGRKKGRGVLGFGGFVLERRFVLREFGRGKGFLFLRSVKCMN